MLRDLEAFLRYVTLIAVRFYLLTYLLYDIPEGSSTVPSGLAVIKMKYGKQNGFRAYGTPRRLKQERYTMQ